MEEFIAKILVGTILGGFCGFVVYVAVSLGLWDGHPDHWPMIYRQWTFGIGGFFILFFVLATFISIDKDGRDGD